MLGGFSLVRNGIPVATSFVCVYCFRGGVCISGSLSQEHAALAVGVWAGAVAWMFGQANAYAI